MVIKRKMICMNKKLLTFALGILTLGMISGVVLSDEIDVSTDVNPYISALFEYDAVAYASLDAGTHDTAAPDQAVGIYNVTVDTNYEYEVSASGTDFTGATSNFDIGNLKMDTDPVKGSLANTTAVTLTGAPQVIDTGLLTTDTVNYHGYWLSIPAAQYAEAYTSTVTVDVASV
jgi:hypothetical protein